MPSANLGSTFNIMAIIVSNANYNKICSEQKANFSDFCS